MGAGAGVGLCCSYTRFRCPWWTGDVWGPVSADTNFRTCSYLLATKHTWTKCLWAPEGTKIHPSQMFIAEVWSCSLGWELSSWFQTGAKMSKGVRFGDSVEVQAGLGLLFLSHIWEKWDKGDKYQFDKERGSGGSLEKTSFSKTKLLKHPRDHPSVPTWCSGGCSHFWDTLVFAFSTQEFWPAQQPWLVVFPSSFDLHLRQVHLILKVSALCVFLQFSLKHTHIVIFPAPFYFFLMGRELISWQIEVRWAVCAVSYDKPGVDGESWVLHRNLQSEVKLDFSFPQPGKHHVRTNIWP